MSNATTEAIADGESAATDDPAFDSVEQALRDEGPRAALERLAEHLDSSGDYRALLDALLLRARHELGLPLIASGSLSDLPEPERARFEERYIEVIRLVGGKFLDAGDIPTAWAYFRAIGETDRVARAILDYRAEGDEDRLGSVIEVAFNHGVNPLRGFELILEHYGTCSSVTAFEQLPPHDEALRVACAGRLIGRLHRDLVANLRSEIVSRGQLSPPDGASIADLIASHDWLFADESYHVDISHLSSVVRMSILFTDPSMIAMAVDLTEYGRRLSPRLQFDGPPPFERIFEDHGIYLGALLGRDVEGAIAHFRSKVIPGDRESGETAIPAQVLVNLLVRLGRLDAALEVATESLAGLPDSALSCPSVAQLCQRTGDSHRLAVIARDHRDLVNYTAALLMNPGS
jgi:hypothetical protein